MVIKVGINGFGRIGRQAFKAILEKYPEEMQVVGINDLFPPEAFRLLLKYDSTYGQFPGTVETVSDGLLVDGQKVRFTAERNPAVLPWGELGVDVVIESTGFFTDGTKAKAHIEAGAKKVVISAPATNEDITVVLGVNEKMYDPTKHTIISNASCTTNCLAPAAKVIHDKWGIVRGLMTTIHSYTSDQELLDTPHRDPRRARSAAINIIPTSTGAARAIALVIPDLKGKFDGMSMRVPTPTVSIVDFVAELKNPVTLPEMIAAFDEAAAGEMKGILGVSHEPLVSSDFRGDARSSIIDADSCSVIGGTMVKVISWYDNEWGYSNRLADLISYMGKKGL
jgi:glyceraldehyde 3-phosphate dehydrogenase